MYLRQRCSDGSVNKTILKPRLAAAAGRKYVYVWFFRRKIPRSTAYTISDKATRFRHANYNPDRAQKLISSSMSRRLSTRNVSSKSMHAFLGNLANRQTNRQTNKHGQNNYLLFVGGNYQQQLYSRLIFITVVDTAKFYPVRTGRYRRATWSLYVAERPRDISCHWILRLVTQGHSRSFEMTPLSKKANVKEGHTPKKRRRGAHRPSIGRWARRWINHYCLWCMASATPDLRLPSQTKLLLTAPTHKRMARLSWPGCLR